MTPGDLGMKAARFYYSCAPASIRPLQEFGHKFRRPRPGAGVAGWGKRPRAGTALQYRLTLIFILMPDTMPRAYSAC